jgi:hypothetical protein
MTRRARFIAAAAFFLIASAISGFFSDTGLEAANKWSSIISMFLALASFTLSALLFQQSAARGSPIPPAPKTAPSPKHSTAIYDKERMRMGDNQTHNTIIDEDNNDDE